MIKLNSRREEIKRQLSSPYYQYTCLAADVDDTLGLYRLLNALQHKDGFLIDILKIHPDIIHGWSDAEKYALRDWAKAYGRCESCLVWADLKLCDVPHIMKMQLDVLKGWANIVTIMSTAATPEILDEIEEVLEQNGLVAFIVPTLHTNGKKIWEDPNADRLEELLSHYPNIIGTVGLKIPGLIYVKAGVGEDEDLKEANIVVRGRSLIKEKELL